ncbi:hypothetical protein C1I60_02360 [Paenibacillus terrae]|uniref:Uncharacterized protein n=1 Tax=Paenibacillus terrae TaxID=159743 RepID=A0A4U2Q8P3_9BACL|nr:hypothetical protein [Paenibacillus terrae]TKH46448.1 hypothetical protein C1I60_02360 [Paenibacillus terrae]
MNFSKKKASQLLVAFMASVVAFAPIGASATVFAENTPQNEKTISVDRKGYTPIVDRIENIPSISELKELGLSDDEIQRLLSIKSSGIYLIDGAAYDRNGNSLEKNGSGAISTQGKLSWAVKLLRAAWDKLPTGVQNAIGGTAGFATLLSIIDTYTGAVEDAVLEGCKALGMSDTVAWWVTKTLMAFVL